MEPMTAEPMPVVTLGPSPQALAHAPRNGCLLTAADLARMPTDLPSGTVKYELNDGVLVVMPPPGDIQGRRQAKIISYLMTEAEDRGLGEVRGEVGIVLRRNPDRVVGCDAAFILTASLPVLTSAEGYFETIPELVVEVRSRNDSNPEIATKAEEYFRAGVRAVWVLDPAARTVADRRPDSSVQLFREADTLTCDLLPGFGVPVARLFTGM